MDGNIKTSDLNEFEKQIDNVVDLDQPGRLSEDKINSISSDVKQNVVVEAAPPPKMIKVHKNIVLCFISDATGCGFIRCFQPFSYLNFVFGKSQTLMPIISCAFIHDENVLIKTRTIYFQRQMAPEHLNMIKEYKNKQSTFKYKMIWEMDDHIWWEDKEKTINGVPPYNFGASGITKEVKLSSIEIMNMMDQLIVSTQFLADYISKELGVKVPIKVVPNHVAKYFWKDTTKKAITSKIEKPKVIYTGSPTHYSNEKKLYGDWENSAWREFVVKNVKDNKISFTCFGGLPWFFDEIKDKIKVIGWLNSFQYHLGVMGEKADFGLMPLVPNNFNRGKSNLKYLEYCASGVLGIGTSFVDKTVSPYDCMDVKLMNNCTLSQIEELFETYRDPKNYNRAIENQYKFLDDNGHWLESKKWIDNFMSVL